MFLNNVSQVNKTLISAGTKGMIFTSVREAKESIFQAEVKGEATSWVKEEIIDTTASIEEKNEQRFEYLAKLAELVSLNKAVVEPVLAKKEVKAVKNVDAVQNEQTALTNEETEVNEPAGKKESSSKSNDGQMLTLRQKIDSLEIELEVASALVASLNRIYKSGTLVKI